MTKRKSRKKNKKQTKDNNNQPKGGFSNKKKREFLKEKRKKKYEDQILEEEDQINKREDKLLKKGEDESEFVSSVTSDYKLRSLFVKDTEEVIQMKKKSILQRIDRENLLEFEFDKHEPIDIPLPPEESILLDHEKLEKHFKEVYLKNIEKKYGMEKMNYFELNVHVWKELWTVLLVSDVILVMTDIRHPLLHFPKSLYEAVVNIYKKPMVLVLNKCDMVTNEFSNNWKNYIGKKYPKLRIIEFSSFQTAKKKKKLINKEAIFELWNICKEITDEKFSKNWDELVSVTNKRFETGDDVELLDLEKNLNKCLKIGVIGHPNTGKSTLINTLFLTKRVASTSMTPGKTKQVKFFELSNTVRLVDSPGLVFPIYNMNKEVAVLVGIFPIAQVRVPIYTVKYLVERMYLEEKLQIKLPEEYEEWSAYALCESYAEKKNFKVKRGKGSNDVQRAANYILRKVLLGDKIKFLWYPPGMERPKIERKFNKVVRKVDKKKKEQEDYFNSLFE